MKLLSLFDGSGGFPLAAMLCGIEPVMASEVEPYPIAVTKSRFPNIKHLGSVTDINGGKIEPVDIITFGSPCFVAGTLVKTSTGLRPIEELRVGDKVLTHKLRYREVVQTMSRETTELYKIHTYGADILETTAEHPFWVRRKSYRWNKETRRAERAFSDFQWLKAKELNTDYYLSIPVEQTEKNIDWDGIEFERNGKTYKLNNLPLHNKNFYWFIGRWLGDGWVAENKRSDSDKMAHKVILCCGKKDLPEVESHLKGLFHYYVQEERTVYKLCLSNKELFDFLKRYGRGAENKFIHQEILQLPKDLLEAVLDGYWSADGCFTNNSYKATTVSKKLAYGLAACVNKVYKKGCAVYKTIRPPKCEIEGRIVNQRDTYQVVFRKKHSKQDKAFYDNGFINVPIRSIEVVKEDCTVYNIGVDEDESYTANGICCHNCQDLSLAGARKGLKHEGKGDDETTRSGLFMEAIRIIREMREATDGLYPRFAIWENVPGAFSSNKGQDFRTVLGEFVKINEASAVMPDVPKAGWNYWDCFSGDGWSLAYRTFDAQYWGVPQRRRRIYLVCDFAGQSAGKILFERNGLSRHIAESRTERENITRPFAKSIKPTDNPLICFEPGATSRLGGYWWNDLAPTLRAEPGDNLPAVCKAELYSVDQGGGKSSANILNNLSPTLTCTHGGEPVIAKKVTGFDGYNGDITGDTSSTLGVNCGISTGRNGVICMATQQGGAEVRIDDKAPTLTAAAGMSGNNQPVICLQGNGVDRADKSKENGKGWKEDVAYTLNTIDRHAVCYAFDSLSSKPSCPAYSMGTGCFAIPRKEQTNPLMARDYKQGPYVFIPTKEAVCIGNGQADSLSPSNQCRTLSCMHDQQIIVAIDRETFNCGQTFNKNLGISLNGVNSTLNAQGPGAVAMQEEENYIVRRLTPTECARLQGFPDDWGEIDHKEDFTDDEYKFWLNVRNTHAAINGKTVKEYTKKSMLTWYNKLHSDGAEYKMWGNGIALPNALYVMQGITLELLGEQNEE